MDFTVVTALQQSGQKVVEWIMLNFLYNMNPKVALQDQNQDENYKSFSPFLMINLIAHSIVQLLNEVLIMCFFKYPMYKTIKSVC